MVMQNTQLISQLNEIMVNSRIDELFKRRCEIYLKSERSPHAKWECMDRKLIYNFELYNSPKDGQYFRILLNKGKLNKKLKADLIGLNSLKSGIDFVDYSIADGIFKETAKEIYTVLRSHIQ